MITSGMRASRPKPITLKMSGGTEFTTCAGLHVAPAPTKSGKSLLSVALATASQSPACWLYVNEPGGTFIDPEQFEATILKPDHRRPLMIVDSASLWLLHEGSKTSTAAMKGGLTLGHIKALSRLDQAARDANVAMVFVINQKVIPLEFDDALTHGQIKYDLAGRRLLWRDRLSGRVDRVIEFTTDELAAAAAELHFEQRPEGQDATAHRAEDHQYFTGRDRAVIEADRLTQERSRERSFGLPLTNPNDKKRI